jgi:hypothetical protein
MLKRCYNLKDRAYYLYGGAGVKVARRWHKFENFLADMGEQPCGLQLDRKNNNLAYSKSNCRWATTKEQAANRRRPRWHGPSWNTGKHLSQELRDKISAATKGRKAHNKGKRFDATRRIYYGS